MHCALPHQCERRGGSGCGQETTAIDWHGHEYTSISPRDRSESVERDQAVNGPDCKVVQRTLISFRCFVADTEIASPIRSNVHPRLPSTCPGTTISKVDSSLFKHFR
jgi:hypothetical protein